MDMSLKDMEVDRRGVPMGDGAGSPAGGGGGPCPPVVLAAVAPDSRRRRVDIVRA